MNVLRHSSPSHGSGASATKATGENSVVGRTVQEAIYETIHQTAGHPPKAIAEEMGLTPSVLYDIADEHRERRLRAEEIPALVKATNNFAVLDVLEARVGRVAFHLPPQVLTLSEESQLAIDAVREFSETLTEFTAAIRDGQITVLEAASVARQADEAIAAIARIKTSSQLSATKDKGAR